MIGLESKELLFVCLFANHLKFCFLLVLSEEIVRIECICKEFSIFCVFTARTKETGSDRCCLLFPI